MRDVRAIAEGMADPLYKGFRILNYPELDDKDLIQQEICAVEARSVQNVCQAIRNDVTASSTVGSHNQAARTCYDDATTRDVYTQNCTDEDDASPSRSDFSSLFLRRPQEARLSSQLVSDSDARINDASQVGLTYFLNN